MSQTRSLGLWPILLAAAVSCAQGAGEKEGARSPAVAVAPAPTDSASPLPICPPDAKYEGHPKPALSSELPAPVALDVRAIRSGDDFTVWGASYSLRSAAHRKELAHKKVTLVGFIIKTNLSEAPRCAVHRTGKADPEGCRAEVPTFWIADAPDAPLSQSIRVTGWASNYASIYDAIKLFDSKPGAEYLDQFWGISLPNPLPAVGAKVRVTGDYSTSFNKSSSGAVVDSVMGLFTYDRMEYITPAPDLATLPGVLRKVAP